LEWVHLIKSKLVVLIKNDLNHCITKVFQTQSFLFIKIGNQSTQYLKNVIHHGWKRQVKEFSSLHLMLTGRRKKAA